jgi:hypothetical protein
MVIICVYTNIIYIILYKWKKYLQIYMKVQSEEVTITSNIMVVVEEEVI